MREQNKDKSTKNILISALVSAILSFGVSSLNNYISSSKQYSIQAEKNAAILYSDLNAYIKGMKFESKLLKNSNNEDINHGNFIIRNLKLNYGKSYDLYLGDIKGKLTDTDYSNIKKLYDNLDSVDENREKFLKLIGDQYIDINKTSEIVQQYIDTSKLSIEAYDNNMRGMKDSLENLRKVSKLSASQ